MRSMQFKSIPLGISLKDIDRKKGIVRGYFSSFNIKDDGGDIVLPGAFKKTIQEWGKAGADRILHLFGHDRDKMLSKPDLEEDKVGLLFTSKISKTTWGKDVLVLYEDGIINEHSIGYDTIRSHIDEESKTRQLIELKLWEGSSVAWGMNMFTPTVGVKSKEQIEKELKQFDAIEKILHDRDISDELAIELEARLKHLKSFVESLSDTSTPSPRDTLTPSQRHEVAEELKNLLNHMKQGVNLLQTLQIKKG